MNNSNYPWPTKAQLQRENDHEREALEQTQFAAEAVELRTQWAELKGKLTAQINYRLPLGVKGRGFALACLEDADLSVAMLLTEAE